MTDKDPAEEALEEFLLTRTAPNHTVDDLGVFKPVYESGYRAGVKWTRENEMRERERKALEYGFVAGRSKRSWATTLADYERAEGKKADE